MDPNHKDKRLYNIADYEKMAGGRFFRHAYDYFNSGANDEASLKAQEAAFNSFKLKHRTFGD